MWKYIFLYLTAYFFFVVPGMSQVGFVPGYVIKTNGDTLSGYIKNQNGSLNSRQVIFEKDRNGIQMNFFPQDLEQYRFLHGEVFLSVRITYRKYEVHPEKNNNNMSRQVPAAGQYMTSNVFLNVLVKGPASLYKYTDGDLHPHYFVKLNDGGFHELFITTSYKTLDYGYYRNVYSTQKNYVDTLKSLFSDVPKLQHEIESCKYKDRSLINIVKAYNEAVSGGNDENVVYRSSREIHVEKTLMVGMNLSNYHFNSSVSTFNYLTEPRPGKSLNLNAGIILRVYYPVLSKRFSVETGVTYYSIKYEYQYIENPTVTQTNIYNVHLENHYLKIPLIFDYDLSAGPWKPFVKLGTPCNIVIRSSNDLVLVKEGQTGSTVVTRGALEPPSNLSGSSYTHNYELLGIIAGAGIKHISSRHIGYVFEISYERVSSITSLYSLGSSAESFFFKAGFIF